MSSKIIHSVGAAAFGVSWIYDTLYLNEPVGDRADPVGRWKFLSFWNLTLQFLYHVFSLYNDFKGSNEIDTRKQSKLQKVRDVFFSVITFPLGLFVAMTFWILFTIDREMVYPEILDETIPKWHNQFVHSLPTLLGFVSLAVVPKYFADYYKLLISNVSFISFYAAWTYVVAGRYRVWAYPIQAELQSLPRFIFCVFLCTWETCCFLVGMKLMRARWGKKVHFSKASKNGKKSS